MTFAQPQLGILAVLISIGAVILALIQRRLQKKRLAIWGSAAPSLIPRHESLRQVFRGSCLFLATLCLDMAIARPQWGSYLEKTPHSGVHILFALDTSKSMLANDVRPNRLELAKLSILDLLASIRGSQVGLMVFAGSAFLQCPPTTDFGAFKASLREVNTDSIQHGGTNLAAVLLLAKRYFDPQANYKHMVLITDGEDLSGGIAPALESLKKAGIVVHTIGIGTPKGAPIVMEGPNGMQSYKKGPDGQTLLTRLDEATLKTIASTTGGFYAPLGNAGDGLKRVYDRALKQLPKEHFESVEKKPIERYPYFAWVALILFALEPMVCALKSSKRS